MRIGILALQGAFLEHKIILKKLSAKENIPIECVEIRQIKDLNDIDGLILPGGESTVQGQLLKKLDLFDPIKNMINNGLPLLATCAGLILLAEKIDNDPNSHLGTLPVTVHRNAYGRQLGSFMANSDIGQIKDFPMVFIRAPYITQTNKDTKILALQDEKIVGVEYKNQLAFAFHPEMTNDYRIHHYFIKKIQKEFKSAPSGLGAGFAAHCAFLCESLRIPPEALSRTGNVPRP